MINSTAKDFEASQGKVRDLHKQNHIEDAILRGFGERVFSLISDNVELGNDHTTVMMTNSLFNIHSLSDNYFKNIVNLDRINDIKRINNYLEVVNQKLPEMGILIGCVETKEQRKHRILNKYPPGLAHVYYFFDFILKRIFPNLPVTRKIYTKITAGRNRVLSRTETMGRLYACGFSVVDEQKIGNLSFFVARKIKEPNYDPEPSDGFIYKMKRIGKNGKIINVYKIRTMHSHAEYLQQFIYERNSLKDGGKFKDDFRISTLGKFLRKYWIDELPMIINLIKGDIKLVGVRPLSSHYMSLYTNEVKEKRLKFKPGLIPPFYADMPKTLNEIMQSELKYLEQYEKDPLRTDFKYFFKALNNILFKKARSN